MKSYKAIIESFGYVVPVSATEDEIISKGQTLMDLRQQGKELPKSLEWSE